MSVKDNKEYKVNPFGHIPKDGEFQVPDGYFENLQDQISSKLNKETPVSIPRDNTMRKVFFYAGIAAVLAIGFRFFSMPKSRLNVKLLLVS